MKYNDDLFNISSEYYTKTDTGSVDGVDKKTLQLEKELLEILLKKFRSILTDKSRNHKGILKTKFKSKFWGTTDDGYNQIKKLIELGQFDSFANQYCLYLGNVCDRYDEYHDSYYEIIWDYRTYFETLSMHEINKGLETKEDKIYHKNDMVNAITSFKKLPLKHQLAVMKSFMAKVKKETELEQRELIEQECINKGHDYNKWKKINYSTLERNPYLDSRDYSVPSGMEYISVSHTKWERTCLRCGIVETVEQEPQELIDARKEKNKQAKIKKLEKELKRLKNEKFKKY